VVFSLGGPFDVIPASAKLILGQYVEDAWNHGKRVYKRLQTKENKFRTEVLLFYWDGTDGTAQCGWWFGDCIGGGKVWGFNPATTPLPPDSGWHSPVDGPVQEKLRCLPKVCRPPPPPPLFVKQEDLTHNSWTGFQSRPIWKRPRGDELGVGTPAVTRAVKSKFLPEPQSFVMISTHASEAPWGTQRVLGEYEHQGHNHGRRAFRKRRPLGTGFDEEPVYLYYWDERDGMDSAGWWLGNRIGGAERFGWAALDSLMPPTRFWRVPCTEASARADLWLVPTGRGEEVQMEDHERLAAASAIVDAAESEAFRALMVSQSVRATTAMHVAVSELQEKTKVVEDALNLLRSHAQILRRTHSSCCLEFELLDQRLQVVLESVQKELSSATWKLQDPAGRESASQQACG